MSELSVYIEKFLEYLQVERGSSLLTVRNYRHYLTRFEHYLENELKVEANLAQITPENVRQFRVYLSQMGLAKRTQSYHAISVRSFLKWLTKKDISVMSPDKIELPKIAERQVKFLSGEQVDRLLSAPSLANIVGKRDKAILEMLFSTGLRVSELSKLNRDNIDFERRELGIVGKGGRARVVFLSSRASDWVSQYVNARRDTWSPLFVRHKGKMDISTLDESTRLTPRSIQRLVKKYAKKVSIPIDVTPHMLRHSFATDLLVAGADLRSVQEMLGHKNIATTQIYTHVTNKHLKDVHEAFHDRQR